MGTSAAFNQPTTAIDLGQVQAQISSWRHADRTLHRLWFAKGKVLAKQGYHEAALASFDAALRLRPNHAKSWIFRGVVLTHLRQYKAALASFDRALALTPNNRETWIFRGAVLMALGDRETALHSYNMALDLQQSDTEVCKDYPLWCPLDPSTGQVASA